MDIVQQQLLELGQKVEATNRVVARLEQTLSSLLEEVRTRNSPRQGQPAIDLSQHNESPLWAAPGPDRAAPPSAPEHLLWESSPGDTPQTAIGLETAAPAIDRWATAPADPSGPSPSLGTTQPERSAPEPEPWSELRPDLRTDLHPELRPGAQSGSALAPHAKTRQTSTRPSPSAAFRSKSHTAPSRLRPDSHPELRHKDVLEDDDHYGDNDFSMQDRPLALDMQVQRLTAQLTAAYNRIAALEERLLSQRIYPSRDE